MFRANILRYFIFVTFLSSSTLWAQQTVPGTNLVSAPLPVSMPAATEAEVLWACEDYVRATMIENTDQSISVGDMVAVIADFASNTGRIPPCPKIEGIVEYINADPLTHRIFGPFEPQFTPAEIDSIASTISSIGGCDEDDMYMDVTGSYSHWPPEGLGDPKCVQVNAITTICIDIPTWSGTRGGDLEDEDMWGSGEGGGPGGTGGDPEGGGGGGPPGGGGGGSSPSPETLSGSPPLSASTQSELYTRGPNAKTISSTFAAGGWRYERGTDLRVSLPGTDFVLQREYTNGPIMQGSEFVFPWHLGRGWQTNAQSWVVYKWYNTLVDPSISFFEQLDVVQVHNYPVAGTTSFYPDASNNLFRSGGGGATTVHVETVSDYVDPRTGNLAGDLQVFVQRTSGQGIRAYYFHNPYPHTGLGEPEPPLNEALTGSILFEEDEHGNRWTYGYFFANAVEDTDLTGQQIPVLDAIYFNGTGIADSDTWVKFIWNVSSDIATPGDGHLMGAEVHRRFDMGNESFDIVTDKVVYKTAGDLGLSGVASHLLDAPLPTINGIGQSADNLLQVEIYNAVDLPVNGDSVAASYDPEYASKITQYRYTSQGFIRNANGSSQSAGEVLTYEFGPSTFEWLAEHATASAVVDIFDAADLLLDTAVDADIPVTIDTVSDTVKPLDLADSITEYYDEYPMLGQVHRQWTREGSGRGMTKMLEYDYARAFVNNWHPPVYDDPSNDFDFFDELLKPRRYATRIREFVRDGDRQSSLAIVRPMTSVNADRFMGENWTENKITYHWSEDVIMHEFAVIAYWEEDNYETPLPFLRRYRTPVTVATAIMEPGWTPTSIDKRAWFTFTKYSNDLNPDATEGYWIRGNGNQLQLYHPSALVAPDLEYANDGLVWDDRADSNGLNDSDGEEIPYLLDYGASDYTMGSTGFMAANGNSDGGFVERWEYDELNRLKATYEEQVTSISAIGSNATHSELIEKRVYELVQVSLDSPGVRTDLVKKIINYREMGASIGDSDSSDQVEVVEYSYEMGLIPSHAGWSNPESRVVGKKTITELATIQENGLGGSAESYVAFDNHGDSWWHLSPDDILTTYENDVVTGVTTRTVTGDFSFPSSPWGSLSVAPVSEPYINDSVYDIAGMKLLARDASGVENHRLYSFSRVFGDLGGPKYLTQVSVPYFWDDNGQQKLAGPVSVEWVSGDGRTIAVRDYTSDTASDITTVSSGVLERSSFFTELGDGASYHLESQFEQLYGINDFTTSYREWYDLGSGQSENDDPYYEYLYEYDELGRSTRTVFPDGTIEEAIAYDIEGRALAVKQGNASGMNTVMEYFYDSGDTPSQGIGRGLLSWTVVYPGDGTARSSRNIYDWRQRQVLSSHPIDSAAGAYPTWSIASVDGPVQAVRYDNLGRVIESATWDGVTQNLFDSLVNGTVTDLSTSGISSVNAISRTKSLYSQEGVVYRTATAIEPESSASANWLVSNAWYDNAGRTLALAPAGGAVQKNVYDTLGRLTQSLVTNGASIKAGTPGNLTAEPVSYSNAIDNADAGEEILKQTSYTYFSNDAPDPIGARHQLGLTEVALRTRNEVGGGLGANPIRSFSGSVYDRAGRMIAGVNFGTNLSNTNDAENVFATGGVAPSLMTSVPDRAANEGAMNISETEYNERGLVKARIDPLGRRAEVRYDPLGRAYATIQNVTGSVTIGWESGVDQWKVDSRPSPERDENRVVSSVLDSNGNQTKQSAHKFDPQTSLESTQTTGYEYDAPAGQLTDSRYPIPMSLSGLLYNIQYPDPTTGQPSAASEDTIRFAYSWLGEQVRIEDQNSTQREFHLDERGRVTHEIVDELAMMGVDDSILQQRTGYDSYGRVVEVASYDATSIGGGEQIVNKVVYAYDYKGDLEQLDQVMSGGITKVLLWEYEAEGYTTPNGNSKRLTHIVYPDGTKYVPDYGTANSTDDLIGRIAGYKVDDGTVSQLMKYEHVGPSTVAIADHRLGHFQMDRTVDSVGRRHFGLDTTTPAGEYAGWDRYGRLQSQSWVRDGATHDTSTAGPDRDELFKENYSWDRLGNLGSRIDKRMFADATDRDWDIRYDELNRVVDARRGITDASKQITTLADGSQAWGLDELGNWEYTDVQGESDQTRTHNESNEISTITDSETGVDRTLTYDNNGNLTLVESDTDGDGSTDSSVQYVYDAWNRLVRVFRSETGSYSNATHVEFEYNPLHWRVAKRVNTNYTSDYGMTPSFEELRVRTYSPSWQMLEEVIDYDISDVDFDRRDTYFWGKRAADDILSKRKTDLTASPMVDQWWHYVTDHLFSVRAVLPGALNPHVQERIEYDSYGHPNLSLGVDFNHDGVINFFDNSLFLGWFNSGDMRADLNGDLVLSFFDISAFLGMYNSQAYGNSLSDANVSDGPDNVIGYAGYHWDEELGMWLSRHRMFDSELGRWMQRDPAGYVDGMNLYAYVRGNPFAMVDPTGLAGDGFFQTLKDGVSIVRAFRKEVALRSVAAIQGVVVGTALGITQTVLHPIDTGLSIYEEGYALSSDLGELTAYGVGYAFGYSTEARQGFSDFSPSPSTGQTLMDVPSDFVDAYNGQGNLDGLTTGALGFILGSRLIPEASSVGTRSPKAGQTGSYGRLKSHDVVGDNLVTDHIPSNASRQLANERAVGREVSRSESVALRNSGTAVRVPEAAHRKSSRTYGGRNTSAKIKQDAANPIRAVVKDTLAYTRSPQLSFLDRARITGSGAWTAFKVGIEQVRK